MTLHEHVRSLDFIFLLNRLQQAILVVIDLLASISFPILLIFLLDLDFWVIEINLNFFVNFKIWEKNKNFEKFQKI